MGAVKSCVCGGGSDAPPPPKESESGSTAAAYMSSAPTADDSPDIIRERTLSKESISSNTSKGTMTRSKRESDDGILTVQCSLQEIQGPWSFSGGKVVVQGEAITLNSVPLNAHKIVLGPDGMVAGIKQKALGRRETIGPEWSQPSAKPLETPVEWKLFGSRMTLGGPNLVWKEGDREVVWARPIKLEALEGEWVNSMGAKIKVEGTVVSLNGRPMEMHPVTVNEDGSVRGIGKLWQLKGWMEDGKLEFKECPSNEDTEAMKYARSVIWTTSTPERLKAWQEQMKGLGYEGSAKDPLNRGVEGCVGGTCDAAARMPLEMSEEERERDKAEALLLNQLLSQWKEEHLVVVPPHKVIPDFTNRGQTGISVEHMHFVATQMKEKGFQVRDGDKGHDMPVLVREESSTELGQKGVAQWRTRLAEEKDFPGSLVVETQDPSFFTSLGNGHFYQALNLYRCHTKSIYDKNPYVYDHDAALKQAVEVGVESLVLKTETPLKDRFKISTLLNSKREYRWTLDQDGTIADMHEDTTQVSQFEALSKVLDAVELNCLVRTHLNIHDSSRVGT